MTYYPKLTFTQPPPLPKYSLQQKPHCRGSSPKGADAHQMLPDWELRQKTVPQLLGTHRARSAATEVSRRTPLNFVTTDWWRFLSLQAQTQNILEKKKAVWRLVSYFYCFSGSGDAVTILTCPVQQGKSLLSHHIGGQMYWALWDIHITPKWLSFLSQMVFKVPSMYLCLCINPMSIYQSWIKLEQ